MTRPGCCVLVAPADSRASPYIVSSEAERRFVARYPVAARRKHDRGSKACGILGWVRRREPLANGAAPRPSLHTHRRRQGPDASRGPLHNARGGPVAQPLAAAASAAGVRATAPLTTARTRTLAAAAARRDDEGWMDGWMDGWHGNIRAARACAPPRARRGVGGPPLGPVAGGRGDGQLQHQHRYPHLSLYLRRTLRRPRPRHHEGKDDDERGSYSDS
eukprot:scaffold585_cov311-Prasinococcus_capsulatus_cf.AAC.7